MRSLWLASAASLFIAGAACAQTSQTGPAPTGAPNAATMTNPGQSPGSTAPATTGSAMSAPNSGAAANNASGAPSGPTVTTPGSSPGKTQMSGSGTSGGMSSSMSTSGMSSSGGMGMSPPMHHHHMGMGMGGMSMPADATAGQYLHMAKGAIKHHNKMMADDALSHAETRMLDRAVPQGAIAADTDPAVSSIESARKAVMAGDMKTANMDIDMAMQQAGGMSADSGMSGGMSSPASMSSSMATPMVHKPMPHSMYGSSASGLAPKAGDTSDSGAAAGGTSINNATMSASKPPSSP